MPISLLNPLPAIAPVRNPLKITFEDNGIPEGEASDVEVLLQIENGAEWETIAEFLNPFDNFTQRASVVINRALIGALNQVPPDPSGSVQPNPDALKNYRIQYRTLTDGEPVGDFFISDSKIAWLAGTDYINPFLDTTGKAYVFQTTRPLIRGFHKQEKIALSILPLTAGTATVNVTINFTDNTSQTASISLGAVTAHRSLGLLYSLPVVTKTIANVEFHISGLTGTAEKLTYKLISGQFYGQLIYANSLGGFDSIPLRGKKQLGHTDEGELFEGQLLDPTPFQEGNMQAVNQSSFDSFLLRSGFLALNEREALKDLTLRNKAYLLFGGRMTKIVIQNEAHEISKDSEFLYSLAIQARSAFSNNAISRK